VRLALFAQGTAVGTDGVIVRDVGANLVVAMCRCFNAADVHGPLSVGVPKGADPVRVTQGPKAEIGLGVRRVVEHIEGFGHHLLRFEHSGNGFVDLVRVVRALNLGELGLWPWVWIIPGFMVDATVEQGLDHSLGGIRHLVELELELELARCSVLGARCSVLGARCLCVCVRVCWWRTYLRRFGCVTAWPLGVTGHLILLRSASVLRSGITGGLFADSAWPLGNLCYL
jgi:hypothetical protein